MNSPLLLRHIFDVVIVDEAGQMTLPATIAPLLKARAFVLVSVSGAKCDGGCSPPQIRLLSSHTLA